MISTNFLTEAPLLAITELCTLDVMFLKLV